MDWRKLERDLIDIRRDLISARQADKDLREEYYDYFKKING